MKIVRTLDNKLDKKTWGEVSGSMSNVKVVNNVGISVRMPRGGWGASNGVNLKCKLDELPASDIELKYSVYVPDSFDFVKGGKLPGFALGTRGTGGRAWETDQGSVRLMFRPGGVVTGYLYLFEDVGKYDGKDSPLMKKQGAGFDEIVHHSNGAGLYIWRNEKDPLRLERGWNKITLRVRINSAGKADGLLSIKVNKTKKSFSKIMYTANPRQHKIGQFQFSSWMGGGDKSYAPTKDQSLIFKDFKLIKRS